MVVRGLEGKGLEVYVEAIVVFGNLGCLKDVVWDLAEEAARWRAL